MKTKLKSNKYLYNGKELQDDQLGGVNLDLYDYHARMYDPVIGRFTTVDPLAEKFPGWSSYVYTLNNPLNLVDPDGREPITFTALALKMAIGAGIGAATDISVQMTANMSLHGQSFSEAFGNLDWTSVGASATIGAVGIPGFNTVAKTATIATAVATDATIDYTISKGTESVFTGEKTLTTATIDAAGSLIGGKATDDILKGAKNSIANDINSGTFSTLTKAEKNTLRQTQSVVNSQGFEAGVSATVGMGTDIAKQGVKSLAGTGGNNFNPMQFDMQVAPSDATRVVTPFYLPEFEK